MDVSLIKRAIREMDKEVNRRYPQACDGVPGERLLRARRARDEERDDDENDRPSSAGRVQSGGYETRGEGRDRRRARDQEEPARQWSRQDHIDYIRQTEGRARAAALFPEWEDELGEDDDPEASTGTNIMEGLGGSRDPSQLSTVIGERDDIGRMQVGGVGSGEAGDRRGRAMDELLPVSVFRVKSDPDRGYGCRCGVKGGDR
jgi:hypothetical protein